MPLISELALLSTLTRHDFPPFACRTMKTRDVQTSEIFDIIQQHIREYLVMLRNRENLSVAQLSEKAGLDENVLADIESGRAEITVESLLKILDFYKKISV